MKKRKYQSSKRTTGFEDSLAPDPIQLTERRKISTGQYVCRIRAFVQLDDDVTCNVDTVLGFVVKGTAPMSAMVSLVEETGTPPKKSGWYISMPVPFMAAKDDIVKGSVTVVAKIPSTGIDDPWTLP
jgi:hypothetical protein